ncbi:MAG: methyltransferase domain-containing protein [Luteitalea sp.]|nr:methyltransferase domain-containing protein [Luteitalea sp.]
MNHTDTSTRDIYNSSAIVTHYARATDLQPAERTILSRLAGDLPRMEMLDIGVGGGRTTRHFAPAVKQYVGVDYSERMIVACRQLFPENGSRRFEVADACDLRGFRDASFDLVLFSFNGIDCIPPQNRTQALREMMRVLRPGAHLVFSAHNSNYLAQHQRRLRPRLSRSPRRMLKLTKRYLTFQIKNRFVSYGPDVTEAFVFDGAERFGVPFVYIRPDEQMRRLRALDLRDVQMFGSDTGAEYDPSEAVTCAEPWAYYVCRKSAP